MNSRNLNTELLAGETSTRKHVPVAVFAVIFIHVALFLMLLAVAGCRARAKAKQELDSPPALAVATAGQEQTAHAEVADQEAIATEPLFDFAELPETAAVSSSEHLSAPAEPEEANPSTYIVQPGDSLWKIARRHGTTVKAIKKQNNLKSDFLKTGQKLRVDFSTPSRAQDT